VLHNETQSQKPSGRGKEERERKKERQRQREEEREREMYFSLSSLKLSVFKKSREFLLLYANKIESTNFFIFL
jgi:hypothetical protein